MKSFSFACVVSSAVLAANFAFAAGGQAYPLSAETSANPGPAASKLVFAELSTQFSGKTANSGLVESPGSRVMLNPQPLPPGSKVKINPQPLPPGSKVTLSPQPLPPGGNVNRSINSGASKVMLSPQPLPPGGSGNATMTSSGAKVLLNQQPPPPKTP